MTPHDDWLMDDDLYEVLGGDTPPNLASVILASARARGWLMDDMLRAEGAPDLSRVILAAAHARDFMLDDELAELLHGDTPPDVSSAVLARLGRPETPQRNLRREAALPKARSARWTVEINRPTASRASRRAPRAVALALALIIVAVGSAALAWKITSDAAATNTIVAVNPPTIFSDNPKHAAKATLAGVRVRSFDELTSLPADITAIEYMPDVEFSVGTNGVRAPRVYTLQGDFADQFAHFTKLESLRIENCALSQPVIEGLGRLTSLRSLTLHCGVGDGDLAMLKPLKDLEMLDVQDNYKLTDKSLEDVAALGSLRKLTLSGCSNVGEVVTGAPLARLGRLQDLDLSGTQAGGPDFLRQLAGLPSLRRLALNDTNAADASMEVVADFASPLETLEVGGNIEITPGGIAAIARVSSLRSLSLRGLAGVNSSTIYALRPLVELVELDLTNCQNIDAQTLVELGDKQDLKILRLGGCDVTDEVAQSLARLQLVELDVTFTRLTDEGVKALSGMKDLRRLGLGSCVQLTAESMTHVAKLPALQSLDLEGSRYIPQASVVAFQRMRPKAAIVPPR
ncbi:MAG: hypothetical protein IT462_10175 [Planctomycetes bacterium]|nr:hypothetical protein [Planctomycetota bacterium]